MVSLTYRSRGNKFRQISMSVFGYGYSSMLCLKRRSIVAQGNSVSHIYNECRKTTRLPSPPTTIIVVLPKMASVISICTSLFSTARMVLVGTPTLCAMFTCTIWDTEPSPKQFPPSPQFPLLHHALLSHLMALLHPLPHTKVRGFTLSATSIPSTTTTGRECTVAVGRVGSPGTGAMRAGAVSKASRLPRRHEACHWQQQVEQVGAEPSKEYHEDGKEKDE